VSANHRFETLGEIAGKGFNVLARCACGHRGTVDSRKLARLFFVRRWDGRQHMIGSHLRCSRCGARPDRVEPSHGRPDGPAWGPRVEADWKRLVARLRD
jgi:hypothetical protein